MDNILSVILLSMAPISELRGGIPVAHALGMSAAAAFFIAVAANIAVAPLLFIFLDYFHKHFMKISLYARLFNHSINRVRRRAEEKIKKWEYLGLVLLVAVPLPITGAYTGTLAAWFFEMDRKKSIIAIASGVVIAGIIVSVVVITGSELFQIFIKE